MLYLEQYWKDFDFYSFFCLRPWECVCLWGEAGEVEEKITLESYRDYFLGKSDTPFNGEPVYESGGGLEKQVINPRYVDLILDSIDKTDPVLPGKYFALRGIKTIILMKDVICDFRVKKAFKELLENSKQHIVEIEQKDFFSEIEKIKFCQEYLVIDLDYYKSPRKEIREAVCRRNGVAWEDNYRAVLNVIKNTPEASAYYKNTIQLMGELYKNIAIIYDSSNGVAKEAFEILSKRADYLVWKVSFQDFKTDKKGELICFDNGLAPDVFLEFGHNVLYGHVKVGNNKAKYMPFWELLFTVGWNKRYCMEDMIDFIIPELENQGVRMLFVTAPESIEKIENIDAVSLKTITESNALLTQKYSKTKEMFPESQIEWFHFDNADSLEELRKISVSMERGYLSFNNFTGKGINYNMGIRRTTGNPCDFKGKVYMLGPCMIRGIYVEDEHTISSYLQSMLTDFKIINLGAFYGTMNIVLRQWNYDNNDIIILMVPESYAVKIKQRRKNAVLIDLYEVLNKIPNLQEHVWENMLHCDRVVNKAVAEYFYEILSGLGWNKACKGEGTTVLERKAVRSCPSDIKDWIKQVASHIKIGAAVMNCNPFTNGHRYLIEEAARQTDLLYIFIVEEDKSYFKFLDRLRLVREGTEDLKNVKVFPSGSYMISNSTMPGYFDKENLQDIKVDTSLDAEFFARYIAPGLGIKVRFVGEEPKDVFTRNYNNTLKEILPQYGISVVEIPRKTAQGEIISASKVRICLKNKEFDKIEKMVPESTFQFLVKNYN